MTYHDNNARYKEALKEVALRAFYLLPQAEATLALSEVAGVLRPDLATSDGAKSILKDLQSAFLDRLNKEVISG